MKEGFRQSMAWLHTWTGLLVGWVLFFVFLTGTFGYVNAEVSHWMQPEEPMITALPPAADLLAKAEARLTLQAADAEIWSIILPGGRGSQELQVRWRERTSDGSARGETRSETLDLMTGQPVEYEVRETGGGFTLYWMHFFLHYVPQEVGIQIVGACSMMMLVAILTGIVAHRRIFKDFFTFRPGKAQRSWLDAHNLLGVTSLPFFLMITWSGLIFYMFAYLPAGLNTLYPDRTAHEEFREYGYGIPAAKRAPVDHAAEPPATSMSSVTPLAPLAPMLADAEARWGTGKVGALMIEHPGRVGASVTLQSRETPTLGRQGRRDTPLLRFDGATGNSIEAEPHREMWPGRFNAVMLGLHEASFAGPALRLLFVGAGLAGTAMIATGLLLWSAKRRAKLARSGKAHAGLILVDTLNLGTIIGLPIGIAAYFWANRLLPVGLEDRAAWEMHSIFIAWGCTFVFALWRPKANAWPELCWFAAGAWGLIPVLNALTTDRHLGVSLPAGDWILTGFDLSAFVTGLFFVFLARKSASGTRVQAEDRVDRSSIEAVA